jgi:hypothetical protein
MEQKVKQRVQFWENSLINSSEVISKLKKFQYYHFIFPSDSYMNNFGFQSLSWFFSDYCAFSLVVDFSTLSTLHS